MDVPAGPLPGLADMWGAVKHKSVVQRTMQGNLVDPCKEKRDSRFATGVYRDGPHRRCIEAGHGKMGGWRLAQRWGETAEHGAPLCFSPGCQYLADPTARHINGSFSAEHV